MISLLQSPVLAIGSAVASLAVSVLVGYGGSTLFREATAPPPPRSILPISLHWNPGHQEIGQLLKVEGGPINATWAASFWRQGRKLCGSGGIAEYPPRDGVYPSDIKWMTVDTWTGDACPEIMPGDTASATWEWQTDTGALRSSSIEFKVP